MARSKKQKNALLWAGVLLVLVIALVIFLKNARPPQLKVYFFKGEKLTAVGRPLLNGEDPLSAAARELLAGPTRAEESQGYYSEVPSKVKIISVRKTGDSAIVDFSRQLEDYGGGSAAVRGMVAQIVYTFTEIKGIEKVRIMIGGKSEIVLGGEGLMIDRPLTREEFKF